MKRTIIVIGDIYKDFGAEEIATEIRRKVIEANNKSFEVYQVTKHAEFLKNKQEGDISKYTTNVFSENKSTIGEMGCYSTASYRRRRRRRD